VVWTLATKARGAWTLPTFSRQAEGARRRANPSRVAKALWAHAPNQKKSTRGSVDPADRSHGLCRPPARRRCHRINALPGFIPWTLPVKSN
jgi:hypothetical protein